MTHSWWFTRQCTLGRSIYPLPFTSQHFPIYHNYFLSYVTLPAVRSKIFVNALSTSVSVLSGRCRLSNVVFNTRLRHRQETPQSSAILIIVFWTQTTDGITSCSPPKRQDVNQAMVPSGNLQLRRCKFRKVLLMQSMPLHFQNLVFKSETKVVWIANHVTEWTQKMRLIHIWFWNKTYAQHFDIENGR